MDDGHHFRSTRDVNNNRDNSQLKAAGLTDKLVLEALA
jgi:hypothetical protein